MSAIPMTHPDPYIQELAYEYYGLLGVNPKQQNSPHFKSRAMAARVLAKARIRPNEGTYITATDKLEDEEIFEIRRPDAPIKAPNVCGVTGVVAAMRISENLHRLSTPEEVDRFHLEMREREQDCARLEASGADHKQATAMANAFARAMKQDSAPSEIPRGVRRQEKAGEKE